MPSKESVGSCVSPTPTPFSFPGSFPYPAPQGERGCPHPHPLEMGPGQEYRLVVVSYLPVGVCLYYRELSELPYVKSCIALGSGNTKAGAGAAKTKAQGRDANYHLRKETLSLLMFCAPSNRRQPFSYHTENGGLRAGILVFCPFSFFFCLSNFE